MIDAQLHDEPEEEIQRLQASLNRLYDDYQRRHGLINSRAVSLCFRDDDGYFLLCSLEVLDDKGNFKGKSDIFTKRTIRPNRIPARAETASDAFALSIGERARVDMPYMMELTGKDEQTLVRELTGVIFVEPFQTQEDGSPVYLAADEYLSGDVRQKLRTARVAAEQGPAFRVNVQALEQVQPKDLTASEISVRLGATWIEPEIIKEFADELFSAKQKAQIILRVLSSIFATQMVCRSRRSGAQGVSRELCGVALYRDRPNHDLTIPRHSRQNLPAALYFRANMIYNISMKGSDSMSQFEQLDQMLTEQGGMLRTGQVLAAGISKPVFYQFVQARRLEQAAHGIYLSRDAWMDTMYLIHLRFSRAVFSHDTALFFHDLTDREPLQYTVTVKTGYNPSRLKEEGVQVFTIKAELHEVGLTEMQTPFGHPVPVYDLERTICDVLRSRNSMELQTFQSALKQYARRRDKDLRTLTRYARLFHVEKILRQYLEVLL